MLFEYGEDYKIHPEGNYVGSLKSWNSWETDWGLRVQWVFETPEGEVSVWTGRKFHPKASLYKLVSALGATLPRSPQEAEKFDPETLIGKKCGLKVIHRDKNGAIVAAVEDFFPIIGVSSSGRQQALDYKETT